MSFIYNRTQESPGFRLGDKLDSDMSSSFGGFQSKPHLMRLGERHKKNIISLLVYFFIYYISGFITYMFTSFFAVLYYKYKCGDTLVCPSTHILIYNSLNSVSKDFVTVSFWLKMLVWPKVILYKYLL